MLWKKIMNGGNLLSKSYDSGEKMYNVDAALDYYNNLHISKGLHEDTRLMIIRHLENYKIGIDSDNKTIRQNAQQKFEKYMRILSQNESESDTGSDSDSESRKQLDYKTADDNAAKLIEEIEAENLLNKQYPETPGVLVDGSEIHSPDSDQDSPDSKIDSSPPPPSKFSFEKNNPLNTKKTQSNDKICSDATCNLNKMFEELNLSVSERSSRIYSGLSKRKYGRDECSGTRSSLCIRSIPTLSQHRVKAIRKTHDYVYFNYQMSTLTGGVQWLLILKKGWATNRQSLSYLFRWKIWL